MADISHITLNGTTYDLKDTTARSITLEDLGIHIGTTPPDQVTTSTVPVGEIYIYVG